MENATKALLVAGAILIAIVLISVGIKILSSTSGISNEVDDVSTAVQISTHNSQFTDYIGKQTGTQLKAVLSKAATTYRSNGIHKVSVKVLGGQGLTAGTYDTANNIATVMSNISVNSTYTVGVEYDTAGYVNCITVNS